MSQPIAERRSMREIDRPLDGEFALRTISGHQEVLRVIYGAQNLIGSSPRSMVETLQITYGTLSERERNGSDVTLLREPMFELGTIIFCLANQMGVRLDVAMAIKYPGECYYCHRIDSCVCEGKSSRAPKDFNVEPRADLLERFLSDWQAALARHYKAGNAKRGVNFVMRRFSEEMAELLRALRAKQALPIYEEIADVFAWWMALATIFEIDAARLLVNPFRRDSLREIDPANTCYACSCVPCARGPFCMTF